MASANNAKKGANVRMKRKERKNIAAGQAHIQSTFNNTVVTITDLQGNEEHEPALVHPFRRLCRTGDGKGLVAHGKDHVEAAQTVALVALQHGQAVEQMPRLDHERHQKGRQRRECSQQKAGQYEFQRAAVHHRAHEHGHPHRQPQRLYIDAVAQAQHKITRQNRQGLGCGGTQRPQNGALRPHQKLFVCLLHLLFPQGSRHSRPLCFLKPISLI